MTSRGRVLKTQAVVLRRSDLGEADRLLTLFTRDYGKLRAVAKGVRKPTARAAGHVELYTLVDMVLAQGRDLFIVSQAELIEPYLGLQDDLKRIGYASLFSELIDRFTVDEEPQPDAFELLAYGLNWLCEPDVDLRLAARYYELRLLSVMGYGLSLFQCAIGGERLEAEDQFYSVTEGGVVCSEHAAGYPNMTPMSLTVFKVLRHMMRSSWETIKVLQVGPLMHHDLQRVLHSTLIFLLEKRLQSIDFLRKIQAFEDQQEIEAEE